MKESINKTKGQPTEWEKIFVSDMSEKGLISKTQNLNKHLPKEETEGQVAHEKMFSITPHQGNADQNHNEISFHSH